LAPFYEAPIRHESCQTTMIEVIRVSVCRRHLTQVLPRLGVTGQRSHTGAEHGAALAGGRRSQNEGQDYRSMPALECSRTREVLRKRDAWSKTSCLRGSPKGDVAIHHAALKRGMISLPSGRWCACGESHAHGYMTHSAPDFVVNRAPQRVRAAHVLIAC
jgi:hypothetical protein